MVLAISIYHGLQMRAREAGFKLRVDHTVEHPLPVMPADRVREDSPDEQRLSSKHFLVRAAIVTYQLWYALWIKLVCL